jgi:site-specific recombinase XerD
VFISHKTGKPLTVYGIRWAIQECLRRAGLDPIKPYSLRGSAATHLLLGGMGVLHISKLLGHESVTTTQGYLDLRLKELQRELSDKHPRKRMEEILKKRKEN